MARPGVMFYFDMLPALKRLTKVQKADLFEALLEYAQHGVLPEFNDVGVSVAWDFIQPRIDRDAQAYELKCLKNQYSVYCREAKRMGKVLCNSMIGRTVLSNRMITNDIFRCKVIRKQIPKINQNFIIKIKNKQNRKGVQGETIHHILTLIRRKQKNMLLLNYLGGIANE